MKTDNELIAEFMGVYETKDSFDSYGHDIPCYYTDNGIYRTRTLTVPGKTFSDFCKAAQYHTSWDWLMPVVEKIHALDLPNVEIQIERFRTSYITHGAMILHYYNK